VAGAAKTQLELLEDISDKLDVVIGFLAVRNTSDTTEQFKRLAEMKLHPRHIAAVVGISENAVAVRLTRMKKKRG
jgi:hypothetical protein